MARVESKCGFYGGASAPSVASTTPTKPKEAPMFDSIIRFATQRPQRVIALWAVVAIALASLASMFGYKVVTDDTARFLPKHSESAQATKYAEDQFGQEKGTRTVTVLVKRADGRALTGRDRADVRARAASSPRRPAPSPPTGASSSSACSGRATSPTRSPRSTSARCATAPPSTPAPTTCGSASPAPSPRWPTT